MARFNLDTIAQFEVIRAFLRARIVMRRGGATPRMSVKNDVSGRSHVG